jgi:hypothetical protein
MGRLWAWHQGAAAPASPRHPREEASPLSGPEGSPELAGGLLGRRMAVWAAAGKDALLAMLCCHRRARRRGAG